MSKKVDDKIVTDAILELFEEMIRNMSPKEQRRARIEFDEIISNELKTRLNQQ